MSGSPRADGIATPRADFQFGLERRGMNVPRSQSAVGGAFTLRNLPSRVTFCATGDGVTGCDRQAPDTFTVDPGLFLSRRRVTLRNDLTLFIALTPGAAPISVDGIVCLPSTSTVDGTSDDICRGGIAAARDRQIHKLDLRNVRLQDLRFEMGEGNSVEREDGDPVEDDLLKVFLDTPDSTNGVTFDRLEYRNGNTTQMWFRNVGTGFRANRLFVAVDMTAPPSIEQASGSLRCGDLEGPFVRVFDVGETLNLTSVFRGVAC